MDVFSDYGVHTVIANYIGDCKSMHTIHICLANLEVRTSIVGPPSLKTTTEQSRKEVARLVRTSIVAPLSL